MPTTQDLLDKDYDNPEQVLQRQSESKGDLAESSKNLKDEIDSDHSEGQITDSKANSLKDRVDNTTATCNNSIEENTKEAISIMGAR